MKMYREMVEIFLHFVGEARILDCCDWKNNGEVRQRKIHT